MDVPLVDPMRIRDPQPAANQNPLHVSCTKSFYDLCRLMGEVAVDPFSTELVARPVFGVFVAGLHTPPRSHYQTCCP